MFVCDVSGFMVQTDVCTSVRVCESRCVSLCTPMIMCMGVCALCASISVCVINRHVKCTYICIFAYVHVCVCGHTVLIVLVYANVTQGHVVLGSGGCVSGCLPECVGTCEGC